MTRRFSIDPGVVWLFGKMPALEQTAEVLLKLAVAGCGCGVARYDNDVVPPLQRCPMRAQDFAHAPAKQIAHHGMPKPSGRDNPETGFLRTRTLARVGQGAEHKKTPCCG